MSSIFEALEEVIDPRFKINTDQNNNLVIVEDQNQKTGQDKGRMVTIKKWGKTFVFTLDIKGVEVFPFFKNMKGLKKKNDAIIFCSFKEKLYILFIEMKSNNIGDCKLQLRSGEHFVKFLIDTLSLHFKIQDIQEDPEMRYIIFSVRKVPKKRTSKHQELANYKLIENRKIVEEDCNSVYPLKYFLV